MDAQTVMGYLGWQSEDEEHYCGVCGRDLDGFFCDACQLAKCSACDAMADAVCDECGGCQECHNSTDCDCTDVFELPEHLRGDAEDA